MLHVKKVASKILERPEELSIIENGTYVFEFFTYTIFCVSDDKRQNLKLVLWFGFSIVFNVGGQDFRADGKGTLNIFNVENSDCMLQFKYFLRFKKR